MHEALRPWVAEIGTVETMESGVHVREPEAGVLLGFRATGAFAMGPRTRATYLAPKRVPDCVIVRLRPGRARPMLGVSLSELVDRVVPLGDLWGPSADALAGELAAMSPAGRCARLASALLERLAARPPAELARAELLDEAAQLLTTSDTHRRGHREGRVTEVARRVGVSERALRDLFTRGVGVSPKRLASLHRVGAVLASGEPLAARAAKLGYYDQSHMTAEFRSVMGVSPGAFLAGVRPAPETC